jgi:hypothetical protein
MTTQAALGFLPSRHGFAFDNSWPPEPAVRVRTPIGAIGIGNAARGLCGGMVFAALDYWHAGRQAPGERPGPASPVYRFIVRRLIRSWHVPTATWRTGPSYGSGRGCRRSWTAASPPHSAS